MSDGREFLFSVSEAEEDMRLDHFLRDLLPQQSRTYLQSLITEGAVLVDDKSRKASFRLAAGETVRLALPDPKALSVEPEDHPLDICYEDCDILVVNKERGMTVHPAPGHMSGTLVNALLHHCRGELSGINGFLRPGIVHRIDKDTSGLLLVCKSDVAHRVMAEQFASHSLTRSYLGLVRGIPKEETGRIHARIGRDPKMRKRMAVVKEGGKDAVTHYELLERLDHAALLRFRLETGRTHQIRVHMQFLGHPLLGDPLYGSKKDAERGEGQYLHAALLGFTHPRSNRYMEFQKDPPEAFMTKLRSLGKR